jgi:hypothetical protein
VYRKHSRGGGGGGGLPVVLKGTTHPDAEPSPQRGKTKSTTTSTTVSPTKYSSLYDEPTLREQFVSTIYQAIRYAVAYNCSSPEKKPYADNVLRAFDSSFFRWARDPKMLRLPNPERDYRLKLENSGHTYGITAERLHFLIDAFPWKETNQFLKNVFNLNTTIEQQRLKLDSSVGKDKPHSFFQKYQARLDSLEELETRRDRTLFDHAAPISVFLDKCRVILDSSIDTKDLKTVMIDRRADFGALTPFERTKLTVYAHILNHSEIVVSRCRSVAHALDPKIAAILLSKNTNAFSEKYPQTSDYPFIYEGFLAMDGFRLLDSERVEEIRSELSKFETNIFKAEKDENEDSLFFSGKEIVNGLFEVEKTDLSVVSTMMVGNFNVGSTPYATDHALSAMLEVYARLKSEMSVLCALEQYLLRRVDAQILFRDSSVVPKKIHPSLSKGKGKDFFQVSVDPITFGARPITFGARHDGGKKRSHPMRLRTNALVRGAAMASIKEPGKTAPFTAKSPNGWQKYGEWFLDRLGPLGSEPGNENNVQTDPKKRFDFFDRYREVVGGGKEPGVMPKWWGEPDQQKVNDEIDSVINNLEDFIESDKPGSSGPSAPDFLKEMIAEKEREGIVPKTPMEAVIDALRKSCNPYDVALKDVVMMEFSSREAYEKYKKKGIVPKTGKMYLVSPENIYTEGERRRYLRECDAYLSLASLGTVEQLKDIYSDMDDWIAFKENGLKRQNKGESYWQKFTKGVGLAGNQDLKSYKHHVRALKRFKEEMNQFLKMIERHEEETAKSYSHTETLKKEALKELKNKKGESALHLGIRLPGQNRRRDEDIDDEEEEEYYDDEGEEFEGEEDADPDQRRSPSPRRAASKRGRDSGDEDSDADERNDRNVSKRRKQDDDSNNPQEKLIQAAVTEVRRSLSPDESEEGDDNEPFPPTPGDSYPSTPVDYRRATDVEVEEEEEEEDDYRAHLLRVQVEKLKNKRLDEEREARKELEEETERLRQLEKKKEERKERERVSREQFEREEIEAQKKEKERRLRAERSKRELKERERIFREKEESRRAKVEKARREREEREKELREAEDEEIELTESARVRIQELRRARQEREALLRQAEEEEEEERQRQEAEENEAVPANVGLPPVYDRVSASIGKVIVGTVVLGAIGLIVSSYGTDAMKATETTEVVLRAVEDPSESYWSNVVNYGKYLGSLAVGGVTGTKNYVVGWSEAVNDALLGGDKIKIPASAVLGDYAPKGKDVLLVGNKRTLFPIPYVGNADYMSSVLHKRRIEDLMAKASTAKPEDFKEMVSAAYYNMLSDYLVLGSGLKESDRETFQNIVRDASSHFSETINNPDNWDNASRFSDSLTSLLYDTIEPFSDSIRTIDKNIVLVNLDESYQNLFKSLHPLATGATKELDSLLITHDVVMHTRSAFGLNRDLSRAKSMLLDKDYIVSAYDQLQNEFKKSPVSATTSAPVPSPVVAAAPAPEKTRWQKFWQNFKEGTDLNLPLRIVRYSLTTFAFWTVVKVGGSLYSHGFGAWGEIASHAVDVAGGIVNANTLFGAGEYWSLFWYVWPAISPVGIAVLSSYLTPVVVATAKLRFQQNPVVWIGVLSCLQIGFSLARLAAVAWHYDILNSGGKVLEVATNKETHRAASSAAGSAAGSVIYYLGENIVNPFLKEFGSKTYQEVYAAWSRGTTLFGIGELVQALGNVVTGIAAVGTIFSISLFVYLTFFRSSSGNVVRRGALASKPNAKSGGLWSLGVNVSTALFYGYGSLFAGYYFYKGGLGTTLAAATLGLKIAKYYSDIFTSKDPMRTINPRVMSGVGEHVVQKSDVAYTVSRWAQLSALLFQVTMLIHATSNVGGNVDAAHFLSQNVGLWAIGWGDFFLHLAEVNTY